MTINCRQLIIMLSAFYPAMAQYLVVILEYGPHGRTSALLRCEASGADFGERVSFESDVMGCALFTEPRNACHNVSIPPISLNSTRYMCDDKFIAIVPRGECTFSEKAYYCQNAPPPGYSALIVYDERGRSPSPMAGGKYAELVNIPVVMISYACMEDIMNNYSADKGFLVMIKGAPGYYDLVKYLIPFIAVVGFCFLILLIALVVRLCREHREVARSRLSRSGLRKIPTRKFVKGEEPETCPICLDDFVEGEKLRILPCRHAYHCKCVDPWLTKNRKVCPVCKRKVGAHDDSSDSDAERNANSAASRERDPLLRSAASTPGSRQVGNSTFYPQYHSTEDEATAAPMTLSPPDSPERAGPSSSTRLANSRTHKGRGVRNGGGRQVPTMIVATVHSSEGDLLASTDLSSSTEQLIPPPSRRAADEVNESAATGVENVAFAPDSPPLLAPPKSTDRRKRHPAAHKHPVDTRLALDDSEDETGSDKESEVGPPLAQSTMAGDTAGGWRGAGGAQRHKRLKKRMHRGAVNSNAIRPPPASRVAASAPAHVPSAAHDDDGEQQQEQHTPTDAPVSRTHHRDDSGVFHASYDKDDKNNHSEDNDAANPVV